MRYILKDTGYIEAISFTHGIECNNKSCIEYTGSVPEGYENLAEWSDNANINAYKIVDGNLTYDSEEDTRLQELWEEQQENNSGGTGTLNGNVVDNLENNSTTDAPSQRAVNEAINDMKNKRREWVYQLSVVSNVSANSWQQIATNLTTDKLPVGKYLVLFSASLNGNSSGISTINPYMDGARLDTHTRSTISLNNALQTSTIGIAYAEFTTEVTHTVNIHNYSNVGVNPKYAQVRFVRID